MVRGNHWWNETPWWAWAVMVVGVVVLAVAAPRAIQHGQIPAASTALSAGPAGPPSSPGAETPSETATRIVVVGDAFTSSSLQGSVAPSAWPPLLRERLDDVSVEVSAADGAGYVTTNVLGATMGSLATAAPTEEADVVVVFGGRADAAGIADQVAIAAGETFAQIRATAPDAALVVIGPAWPAAEVPAGVRNNRGVIRDAAVAAGAIFVDPLEAGWFVDQPDLIAADGVHPTEQGQQYLADLIEPVVRDAIG